MSTSSHDTLSCTCARLRRATRHVTQLYDDALRPLGLRLTQYSLLVTIAKADRPSLTELAEMLVMERTTLTRNLRPLQTQGLIAMIAGSDGRRRSVMLTAAGREAIARVAPRWRAVEKALRGALGEQRAAALNDLLDAVQALEI